MLKRKIIAALFLVLALGLGIDAFSHLSWPTDPVGYFQPAYYRQFGLLAICVELLFAGGYLYVGHRKANFALALFGFTVLAEVLSNGFGVFPSGIALYPTLVLVACAAVSLWLAFTNTFRLGRISVLGAVVSFILGYLVESFFNELFL